MRAIRFGASAAIACLVLADASGAADLLAQSTQTTLSAKTSASATTATPKLSTSDTLEAKETTALREAERVAPAYDLALPNPPLPDAAVERPLRERFLVGPPRPWPPSVGGSAPSSGVLGTDAELAAGAGALGTAGILSTKVQTTEPIGATPTKTLSTTTPERTLRLAK